jgi:histidine triad (HIT) family protein
MHNHAPVGYVCPFCALAGGSGDALSTQGDILFQDSTVTAFVASHQWPNNAGAVIIIPNEHFENIYDLPVHLAVDIHRVACIVALAMKAAYQCDGISTRQHNEPAGNQDVWHYHLHITPRYASDNFYSSYLTQRRLMPVEERAEYVRRLRAHLPPLAGA